MLSCGRCAGKIKSNPVSVKSELEMAAGRFVIVIVIINRRRSFGSDSNNLDRVTESDPICWQLNCVDTERILTRYIFNFFFLFQFMLLCLNVPVIMYTGITLDYFALS